MKQNHTPFTRHIPFSRIKNFRDFGGYQTEDGRWVRKGLLFRSGQLTGLDKDEQSRFADLGIKLICDFRREDEAEKSPSNLPPDKERRTVSLPITPGSTENFTDTRNNEADMAQFMRDINREFVEKQYVQYQRMFEEITNCDANTAILIHCAAGKDRTGFGAAMILAAIGVSQQTIMSDYMLTQEFLSPDRELEHLRRKYFNMFDKRIKDVQLRPMLEVQPHYLQEAFTAIDEHHGSVAMYLESQLGIDSKIRERLRELFVA